MEKVDRRIQRTQELLGNALFELILERDYEAIAIKDVTERANVAYVTFFRHYRDIDELLVQRLDAGISELMEHIDAAIQRAPGLMFGEEEGRLIFLYVQRHAALYRILLNSQGAVRVRKQVQAKMAARILTECPPLGTHIGSIPPEITANHMAASLLALVEWWLDYDMPYSVEQMAQIYDRLIQSATAHAIGLVPEEV
jgi:AcrR family transcriptional regulator